MHTTIGAIIGSALVSLVVAAVTGIPQLFWVALVIGLVVSLPIAFIVDIYNGTVDYREYRADVRQQRTAESIKVAAVLAAYHRQPDDNRVINIDARQVHYHQENKATRFIDKP